MQSRILRGVLTTAAFTLGLMTYGGATAYAQNACMNALQGKVAWDYKGNKRWAQKNLQRLCRGATDAQPARCFQKVMHGKINWGGGTQWKWENAIDLCEQSQDAQATVACFRQNLSGSNWKGAIAKCDERAPRLSRCERALQGKIAWNRQGNKKWAKSNMQRLCRNANNDQPARCFKRVMHGNVNWGGGKNWKWENALDLCEQSKNAQRTISCFKGEISAGQSWKQAIPACDERAPNRPSCKAAVQGKIAWNRQGNKKWAAGNLDRLCRNARNDEPAKCFNRVMHGNINWGGGTNWKWENALDLCEQSRNADRTIRCFKKKVRKGRGWKKAIAKCDERRR